MIVVIPVWTLTPCELFAVELLRIVQLFIKEIVLLEEVSFDFLIFVD